MERLQQPERAQPRLAPHGGHPEVPAVPDGAEECAVLLHRQVPQLHGQHRGGRLLRVHFCRGDREGEKEETTRVEEEEQGGQRNQFGHWKQITRGGKLSIADLSGSRTDLKLWLGNLTSSRWTLNKRESLFEVGDWVAGNEKMFL